VACVRLVNYCHDMRKSVATPELLEETNCESFSPRSFMSLCSPRLSPPKYCHVPVNWNTGSLEVFRKLKTLLTTWAGKTSFIKKGSKQEVHITRHILRAS
jgi:hypothetical protein